MGSNSSSSSVAETPIPKPSIFRQPDGLPSGIAPSATSLARIAETNRNMPRHEKVRIWEARKEARRKLDLVECKICKTKMRRDGLKKHEQTTKHLQKVKEKKKRKRDREKKKQQKKKSKK